MTKLFYLCLFMAFTASLQAQQKHQEAVRTLLDSQVVAWNRADINGFMAGYWNSDSLQFISARGISRGWNTLKASYEKNYPGAEGMGLLEFSTLNIQVVSGKSAVVSGAWKVTNEEGVSSGYFLLCLRKINGQWLITHDHTS